MNRAVFRLLLAGALASTGVGCAADDAPTPAPGTMRLGGQTGGEAGIRCTTATSSEPLAFDAASPLGFSGADLAHALPAESSSTVRWSDGSETTLTVTLAPGTHAAYAASCRANALDVTVSLRTADVALNESAATELFAKDVDDASLDASFALSELAGELTSLHPTLVTGLSGVLVQVNVRAGGVYGQVLGTTADGSKEIGSF